LTPKPPPTSGRDHAQLLLGKPEHRREIGAGEKRILRGEPHRELVAAGIVAASTARGSIGAPARRL
jgi:hypothetical protein